MPNVPKSKDLETGTQYPSYSDIESGSSVQKVMSIVRKSVPKNDQLRVDLHRWPVQFGVCQVDISC